MNARTVAQIFAVAGVLGLLVTGCEAQTTDESTGESSNALSIAQCTKMNPTGGSCPTNGTLSSASPMEEDLIQLGCSSTRVVTKGTVAGQDAFYEVLCPTTTYITFRSTVIVNSKPVVISVNVTAAQLAGANAGAPYYMTANSASLCPYCAPEAPSGSVYIDYDPICGASGTGNCAPHAPAPQ